ncbi:MAG: bifunctional folylpolyglutamate synthase/dihydrofolate synthase [Paludibacteraceae bacterium]|nr:bifunctional folylpolyglutamate synthase/dihydrofolate synthase [Paludibacteraceae bacterium]
MTYPQAIDYLYNAHPTFHLTGAGAYKPGPENILRLMEALGNPHTRLRAVHVAGTNGKGSTSHLIAAAQQAAGLRVGLYTSPHLVDFRERIRINGTPIPEDEVAQWIERQRPLLDATQCSFFETATALAFWWFDRRQVDIAVVEVGLGGRLDATNILTPLLSVITNIGLDHTDLLGDTLPAIAREKAGIIKPGVPCVIGETDPETAPVFMQRAAECGILGDGLETTDCRLWFADQCGYLRRCRLRDVPTCQLHGLYQEHNLQTAYVALQVLRNHVSASPLRTSYIAPSYIAHGFAHVCDLTGLRGRWETLSEHPLTICDTGHNAHGLSYVAEQLRRLHAAGHTLHIVFGMVRDKDVRAALALMPYTPDAADTPASDSSAPSIRYYFTQAATPRALPANQLAQLWCSLHPAPQVTTPTRDAECSAPLIFSSVPDALRAARCAAAPDDIIFIGGSNYIVGEALRTISRT